MPTQTRADRWRVFVRQILPRGVLFVGIALILVHTFRARPSTVDVVYEYGPAQHGLVMARMVYWQGNEVAHRVQFDYHQRRSDATQVHQLRLHDGDYAVEINLTYAGEPPTSVARLATARTRNSLGENQLTLRRPLLVHGAGELHVYLAP